MVIGDANDDSDIIFEKIPIQEGAAQVLASLRINRSM